MLLNWLLSAEKVGSLNETSCLDKSRFSFNCDQAHLRNFKTLFITHALIILVQYMHSSYTSKAKAAEPPPPALQCSKSITCRELFLEFEVKDLVWEWFGVFLSTQRPQKDPAQPWFHVNWSGLRLRPWNPWDLTVTRDFPPHCDRQIGVAAGFVTFYYEL